jgi:hypothetical protein
LLGSADDVAVERAPLALGELEALPTSDAVALSDALTQERLGTRENEAAADCEKGE